MSRYTSLSDTEKDRLVSSVIEVVKMICPNGGGGFTCKDIRHKLSDVPKPPYSNYFEYVGAEVSNTHISNAVIKAGKFERIGNRNHRCLYKLKDGEVL